MGDEAAVDGSELGRRGEELAAGYLVAGGWRILARNFRAGHREVDLVARRGAVLAFVEVKTRAGPGFGHPLEAITRRKRAEIVACARAWLREHPTSGRVLRRFDAVAVHVEKGLAPRIEHVEDAWRVGE